jgi:predicted nucleic acid-binding protein
MHEHRGLQEIHRYTALGRREVGSQVYDLFVQLCPEVLPITLADTDRARTLLNGVRGISARDALHVGVMLNSGIRQIASFDAGFDGVTGIQRLQPT